MRSASWLSEDPKGAVDSPNLYAFVGWGPHFAVDPLGLAVKPHIGYVYELTTVIDGETVRYVGSARDLQERFASGRHKWEDIIRDKNTQIRAKRVRGHLDIAGSNRGTELSARKEALGSVEKLELERSERQAARRNRNLGPGEKPMRILDDDPIVSSETKRAGWQKTHNVSIAKRWTNIKRSGQAFDALRLPSGGQRLRKAGTRLVSVLDVYGTAKDAVAFARDQQLSAYEMAPYVLEDEGGAFVFGTETGELFSNTTYYREFVDGGHAGEREEISRSDFEEYSDEAKALFGYVDWRGEFVPGLLNPRLPCRNCA
jgi:hypothetical protein